MKKIALIALVLGASLCPVWAADDMALERLATCQESWLVWSKTDPARLKTFRDEFQADFSPSGNDAFFVPKTAKSIMGLRVVQAFPDSVGMGVGFSVLVDGAFDTARAAVEKTLGKSLGKCENGENMRSCELEIAEQRTLMLMAQDDPKSSDTLLGCYYYYEK